MDDNKLMMCDDVTIYDKIWLMINDVWIIWIIFDHSSFLYDELNVVYDDVKIRYQIALLSKRPLSMLKGGSGI